MSFLGGFPGRRKPTSAERIAAVEAEMDMVTEMFNRLMFSCQKKCITPDYRDAELNKAESVCLDRCVAKFMDTNIKVSQKMQENAANGVGAGQADASGGGGMFKF